MHINNSPHYCICNIAIYVDDTTLNYKSEQAFDMWQQLEVISELKSNLQDTVDWDGNGLDDFKPGKT